jgi:hypothetical protein
MAAESSFAGSVDIDVWIIDVHRSRNALFVATVNDMNVALFKKRVMFRDDVVKENRWSSEHHSAASLLMEDGITRVDTRRPLSTYAVPAGSTTVTFILEPPKAAIAAGALLPAAELASANKSKPIASRLSQEGTYSHAR